MSLPDIPKKITNEQLSAACNALGLDPKHVRSLHVDAAIQSTTLVAEIYELNDKGNHFRDGDQMVTRVVRLPVVWRDSDVELAPAGPAGRNHR